ncbi:MAG: hypothetical protein ABIJ40_20965 [Bacteroidota bacterium]
MAVDKKILEWVSSSKKRTAVMKAMEGIMTLDEIVEKAKKYDTTITKEEVKNVLEEFEEKEFTTHSD